MDLTPYVDSIRRELMVAAAAGGDESRALAERLAAPLESAIRLTLLNALSTAADEITRDLAPGSVDLRLRGLEPEFVVKSAPVEKWDARTSATMAPVVPPVDEEGAPARINFRPSENLKARIEAAATREGLSVNAWLVRATTTVLDAARTKRSAGGSESYTGWAR